MCHIIAFLVRHYEPFPTSEYADDTILLIQDSEEQAVNLKLLLYTFEAMLGLKVNSEKSEVIRVLEDDIKAHDFAALFNCQQGTWLIKILGYSRVC
jgi:hypothetical protein